jgi:hypothetical protein
MKRLNPFEAAKQGYQSITRPIQPLYETAILNSITDQLRGTDFCVVEHGPNWVEVYRASSECDLISRKSDLENRGF